MGKCRKKVLEFFKNKEKGFSISIYSLWKELCKERIYGYTTVYITIKDLVRDDILEVSRHNANTRMKKMIKLKEVKSEDDIKEESEVKEE